MSTRTTGLNAEVALACHRCYWAGDITNLYACPPVARPSSLPTQVPTEPSWCGDGRRGRIWRYRGFLPVPAGAEPVTLGEGGPRCYGPGGSTAVDCCKNETANPTASFKDRPVAVAATVAGSWISPVFCAPPRGTRAWLLRPTRPEPVSRRRAWCPSPPPGQLLQIEAVGAGSSVFGATTATRTRSRWRPRRNTAGPT